MKFTFSLKFSHFLAFWLENHWTVFQHPMSGFEFGHPPHSITICCEPPFRISIFSSLPISHLFHLFLFKRETLNDKKSIKSIKSIKFLVSFSHWKCHSLEFFIFPCRNILWLFSFCWIVVVCSPILKQESKQNKFSFSYILPLMGSKNSPFLFDSSTSSKST